MHHTHPCDHLEFQQQDTGMVAQDWFLRDPEADKLQGTSTEKTYATLLQRKTFTKSTSSRHRFWMWMWNIKISKDIIWTNEDEIPNNRNR